MQKYDHEKKTSRSRATNIAFSRFRLRAQKRKREIVCYQHRILMREHDICSAKARCFAAKVRCKNIVFSASHAPNIVFSHFCPSRSSAKTRYYIAFSRYKYRVLAFSPSLSNTILIANNFALLPLSAKAKTQQHDICSARTRCFFSWSYFCITTFANH